MRTITVVCPVFNEEAVVRAFHEELRRALGAVEDRWSWSVVYVVDRGTDRTLEILKDLTAADRSVRVLALSSHFGQQASLLAGLDHCDADAVVMMDGTCSTRRRSSPTSSLPTRRGTTSSTPSARTPRTSPSRSVSPRASSTGS